MPAAEERPASASASTRPRGNVINYVRQEMDEMGLCTDSDAGRASRAASTRCGTAVTGSRPRSTRRCRRPPRTPPSAKKGSELDGQPKNLMAAVVSIDPTNGRVLAYYGGDNGAGIDYAGKNIDTNGDDHRRSPAGLDLQGLHPGRRARGRHLGRVALERPSRSSPRAPRSRSATPDRRNLKCGNSCTLRGVDDPVVQRALLPRHRRRSAPDKVVDMARKAGVTTMWTPTPTRRRPST